MKGTMNSGGEGGVTYRSSAARGDAKRRERRRRRWPLLLAVLERVWVCSGYHASYSVLYDYTHSHEGLVRAATAGGRGRRSEMRCGKQGVRCAVRQARSERHGACDYNHVADPWTPRMRTLV